MRSSPASDSQDAAGSLHGPESLCVNLSLYADPVTSEVVVTPVLTFDLDPVVVRIPCEQI